MYIKTERLELKAIDCGSLEALTELLLDPEVGKTYMVPEFEDREAARKLARRIAELSHRAERYVAGIYWEDSLVGIVNETEVEKDRIELGYALLSRCWGRGITTESMKGMIGYCFKQGFSEVTAGAFEDNIASIRVMEKCGMEKLDRTDSIDYRGTSHRCIYYSIRVIE